MTDKTGTGDADPNSINYITPPTVGDFMQDDHFVRLILGPVGCLAGDTEFLTPNGWKRIDQYSAGDLVAQWHQGGEAEFVEPLRYIQAPCTEMIRFENHRSVLMDVTPNHRVPLYDWEGKFVVKTAEQLAAAPSRHTVPVHFTFRTGLGLSEEEIKLRVAVAADGHYPQAGAQCVFALRKDRKKDRLRRLLGSCGIEWVEAVSPSRPTETRFTFARPAFEKPLHKSADWYSASSDELRVLLNETLYWDGLFDHEERRFYSSKREEADVVQFAAHANGCTAKIRREDTQKPGWGISYTVQWAESGSQKAVVGFRGDNLSVNRVVPADGKQYCFEVPATFFIARSNGRIFVTGNSGKSAGCFMELLRRAKLQEPDSRRVRRTRFAIVRNTLQQLRQTCLADIQMWLSPITHFYGRDQTIQVRFPLPDGTTVESDWMLIPLDTKEDQQRLLSLNLTGAWVSEFREIPLSIIDALAGRLGRFPTRAMVDPTWFGIIAESNPPDEDSEWYEKLELKRPANWGLFKQPGGLTPEAENVANLPANYYQNLAANNGPDWVDVHVHAKYGKSLSGQAVFRRSFKSNFHISKVPLIANRSSSIMLAQDFGRTPACLVAQIDVIGRLLVFDELASEDMGIEQFATSLLRPLLHERYIGYPIFMVADPKGRDKSQINEDSPFDVLKRLGFNVFPAITNFIDARLGAVEQLLLQQRDGGPMLLIDGDRCPLLCSAMKHNYRYRRKNNGVLEDTPEKLHPWSDLADCLQYACLSTNVNYIGKVMAKMVPRSRRPSPPIGGWT